MPKLRLFGCAVAFLVAATLHADHEMTGTWSGTYTWTIRGTSCPMTYTKAASGAFSQSGSTVTGSITLTDVVEETGPAPSCMVTRTQTFTLPVNGTVSGTSFSGTITFPGDGGPVAVPFSAMVSGDSLSGTVSGPNDTVSLTMTRTSNTPPGTGLTGTYSGSYTNTFSPCRRLPPITFSGPISGGLVQVGPSLTGFLIATGTKGDRSQPDGSCIVVDRDVANIHVMAQVSGNTITGTFTDVEDSGFINFTATFSGNTITGRARGVGENDDVTLDFVLTRSSTTPPPQPSIASFTANPTSIDPGQSSTLSWSTQNATNVTIDNGVGVQPVNGSVQVSPTQTTTYTLIAVSGGGTATASATVTVAGAAARVVVSSTPRGMVQLAGVGGGADAFNLTNIGTAQTTVALAKSGEFFTIAPTSVTLGPGQSATISISGLAQPAGSFEGTITASGAGAGGLGVRVRLLSSAAPTGSVRPQSTQARAEINAPIGQSASGTVSFTNSGNATLQGIAIADVPWIIPQSGVITIPPGQTVQVSYTVDSSKRPDAEAPLGAVTGSLSLLFLSGTSGPTASDNAAGTSQVSVTLVYVVKPGTSAGVPPPLAGNEVALFVPGLANRSNAVGDFLLSNRQSSGSLSDVKLYLMAAGAPSQLATLPTLPAGASALFPSLLKNVFSASTQTGTAHVRAGDTSKISLAGIQSNTSSPRGTFSTALPLFRSDRGVSNGGAVVLSGLTRETGTQANLYVQELSGAATSVQIQSLDSAGAVIATRAAQSLEAFGLLEVLDATSAQAVSARVLNLGNGRIGAFALVTNTVDSWTVTDPGVDTGADGTMIVPLFSAGTGGATYLFATNRGSSAVTATIDVRGGSRRRAVGKKATGGSGLVSITHAPANVDLSAQQSFAGVITTSTGYIRITAPAGVLSAVGRTVRFDPGQPSYGSGLPAIAASSALATGQSKRFAGVDDASPATRAVRTPATFRSNLMLIETANNTAVVRVTLRYTFAAGTTVSARAVSTREYTVGPSQFVLISDVIADVIGAQRATFGDLRNIDVDVEVVSGGRIIPVLQSIENGSDDSLVRVD